MGGALKKRFKLRDKRNLNRTGRFDNPRTKWFHDCNWKTSYARCVGTSHLETGFPCQDQVGSKFFENGVTAIALSDGAGSSRYSHYGAYIVVHRALDLIAEHFNEAFSNTAGQNIFIKRFISSLQIDLNEAATVGINLTEEERIRHQEPNRDEALLVPCSINDLACTLLVVAVKGNRYIALHVGDGVIGAEIKKANQDQLIIISEPNNGEFANETQFITSSKAIEDASLITGRIRERNKTVAGFILMSDGPEAALYNKSIRSLAPSCKKLFEANRKIDSGMMNEQLYLTIKTVIQRKTSDDCSIALLT